MEDFSNNEIFIDTEWNMKPSLSFKSKSVKRFELTHDWKFMLDGEEVTDEAVIGKIMATLAKENKKEGNALWN